MKLGNGPEGFSKRCFGADLVVRVVLVLGAILGGTTCFANEVTGTIHTLHIQLASNRAHIYLDGQPTFDGGGCTGYWTANSLDDEKFMIWVWPALMNAKNKGYVVTITVNGCEGDYAKITAIDVVPR